MTLKALAEQLGLSTTTISLVLNRSPAAKSIPQRTQDRIFAAAKRHDYRPDHLGRSLRSRRTFSVGVLVQEITEGYTAGVMNGIQSRLLREGYFCLVGSHQGQPEEREKYLRLMRDRLVEGIILVNTPITAAPPLPTVAVSGHERLEGVVNLSLDHESAARLALSHLVELGHRRIALFQGPAGSSDAEERWRTILEAAEELGLETPPELRLQLGDDPIRERISAEAGYREGYALGQELLAAKTRFTAVFAFNDLSAMGAMRAFLDAGLRIPEDVSMVGFDDIESAAYHNPSLTTVRQPLKQMGEMASTILLDRLGSENGSAETVTLEPELVVRDSTGPARSASVRAS